MDITKSRNFKSDCDTILSHLKRQDKLLILKRRWLMGLPLSKSENKKLFRYKSLPESLLREDDIFFDDVKKHVEEAFGVSGEIEDRIIQENKRLFGRSDLRGILLSCLDALTNKGLFFLAVFLRRGSINFEKTRPKLKKVIKELIPRYAGVQNQEVQIEVMTKLAQLFKDPQNVRDNCLMDMFPSFHYHHDSAIKIMNRLGELPSETLLVMRRKLRGDPARTHLRQIKYQCTRQKLIYKVREKIRKMLSELVRKDELQAPLAKALDVAGWSLKLTPGYSNSAVSDFYQVSSEIKTLQNEIVKAICLLKYKTKVKMGELKTLLILLDPTADVPNAYLRTTIKKILTEYLFDCSDLDKIPKSLLDALAIINGKSQSMLIGCFLKDEIEEEVECVLNLSAQMKQVVWDLFPDCDFAEGFTDAYMEDLEESDDNYDCCDTDDFVASGEDDDGLQLMPINIFSTSRSHSVDSGSIEESCGDYVPVDSNPSVTNFEGNHEEKSNVEERSNVNATQFEVDHMRKFGNLSINVNCFSSHFSLSERLDNNSVEENEITNSYLGVQEVCDETAMIAYKLIGSMMDKFAQEEGLNMKSTDRIYLRGHVPTQENPEERQTTTEENFAGSVIIQAVEKLMPALSKSGMEKLKELVGIL
ncbi:uncharacterized protein LOC126685655 isoform X1 [Mercurialis annua]|uniref:uncharacterized protein LOC126685655 isoform X1 n=1 Tax=Mercurialis annua TaxID=3986 RepID=UPI00215E8025|nr:uncharacterized protein LOC126685655 isoform X1 [Mercurialis annua]